MQTSRSFITPSIICAALLGTVSPHSQAHPGGAAVSMGSNPVRSFSGNLSLGESLTAASIFTVPDTQDLIITDVVSGLMSNTYWCLANGRLNLKDTATGIPFAQLPLYFSHLEKASAPGTTVLQATSGIRVPAGTVIDIEWVWSYQDCSSNNYHVPYTITGYLTQP